ncbi:unnamed protein product [Ilex paraguariensis]|uniref:Uncharacterized protein n=1 Tax=Ilex paraguariensis TaxID=185542 RepID=A0ABC8T6A3_9AQUA
MGNCFVSKMGNSNPSISDRSITTGPSTAGTSNNYNNGGGYSATSSSEGTCCDGEIWPTPTLKIYSFADLKKSTANFKSDSVLGRGVFGTVYRGWVDKKTLMPCQFGTGMIVAIKKFDLESLQTYTEWERLNGTIYMSIPL